MYDILILGAGITGTRKFYSSQFHLFLKHSVNTVFFYCKFVKFYVFVYRILSYSVV